MNPSNKKIKKILRYCSRAALLSVVAAIVFGPLGQLGLPTVRAANGDSCTVSTTQGIGEYAMPQILQGTIQGNACVANGTSYTTGYTTTAVNSKGTAIAPPEDALACTLNNPSICLANVVYAFTVGLGSGLAYVGGFMFDTTISLSLNSTAYALSFLSSGWTTARDLANMAFILILVYIAFMIMFQAETAGTIRMLAWVIFIALIINFSFFFTRVIIDVGNILAVQFYNSIDAPSLQQTMDATSNRTGVLANTASGAANMLAPQGSLANTKDLTYSIMNALNIQELFSNQNFRSFANQSGFGTKFIVLTFLYLAVGACYFLLAAMFFAVAIKFIVRVVVLWFLIIASPLAFICKAVPRPEVSAWYDKWQHELVNHAFYPAFFLFIFFFISTIMTNFGSQGGILSDLANSLNAAASDPNLNGFIFIASAVANVGIRLGFVVAMLYIALKASEYMGVKGAGMAHALTNKITAAGIASTRFGVGLPLRGAAAAGGIAGRNLIGSSGLYLSKNVRFKKAASNGGVGGIAAGLALRAGDGLSKQSFDLRGAPGVRSGLGMLGINAGEAVGKGGYTATYAAQMKKRIERSELFKQDKAAVDKEMGKQLAAITDPKEKENIARAAQASKNAQDDVKKYGTGEGRGAALKQANKQLEDVLKPYKKAAEERAGKDFKNNYAKSLTEIGAHNAWGVLSSGIPGYISNADREVATKIRTGEKEDGSKILEMMGIELNDLPDDKKWSHNAKGAVPKSVTVGDREFEIGGKAFWRDRNGKEKQYDIVDIADGKAYLKGAKDPVDLDQLYEEKNQDRTQQTQQDQNNTNTQAAAGFITGLAAAGQATQQGQQTPSSSTRGSDKNVFTVTSAGTATTPEQRAGNYVKNPSQLKGKTLVHNNGEEMVVEEVRLDSEHKNMGVLTMKQSDGTTVNITIEKFIRPENINNYSVKPVPAVQPQADPSQNPVVPYTPPSSGSQTPPPAPRPPITPLPPTAGPTFATESAPLPPEPRSVSRLPERRAPGTGFTMPQEFTDRSGDIIETYEQPDGSFGTTPHASNELIEQVKGLRADVSRLQSTAANPKLQPLVPPTSKQVSWTPKPSESSFSATQKSQIKGLIEKAIDNQTEELGEKIADTQQYIKNQQEWLAKEGKRILDNRGLNAPHINTSENPPPTPPQRNPEDTKPE